MFDMALNLFFPPKCGICGKLDDFICKNCYNMIKEYEIDKNEYSDIFFMYKYEKIIRDLLIKYKFNDASYLYKTFAKCIIKNEKAYNFLSSYDIIIPVPLHWKRKLERGYNQAELIANELGKLINKENIYRFNIKSKLNLKIKELKVIEVSSNILIKQVNIKPQSEQNIENRRKNVKGVYNVHNPSKINGKRIVILDDIYTTGSTCNECKKELMKYNPAEVGIFTIAKDYIN